MSGSLMPIIMASRFEAQPFIDGLQMELLLKKPFQVYKKDNILLVISGIGKTPAAAAATFLIVKYDPEYIINLGTAGALKKDISTGEVYPIRKVLEADRPILLNKNDRFFVLDRVEKQKALILATRDIPAVDSEDRKLLGKKADIIDMEGAAIAQACKIFKKRFYSFKLVTDSFEDDSDEKIMENIKKLRGELFFYFKEKILTCSFL